MEEHLNSKIEHAKDPSRVWFIKHEDEIEVIKPVMGAYPIITKKELTRLFALFYPHLMKDIVKMDSGNQKAIKEQSILRNHLR